jgi:flagellar motility protein MotE (MotC chaperone)
VLAYDNAQHRQDAELQVQREQLEKRMNELEENRKKISSMLEERTQVDEKKVDTLVQLYSSMKPQQAAPVIESLDEDLAVEVIAKMKRKPAADIMNLLKPEKAKVISEKFTGYKK